MKLDELFESAPISVYGITNEDVGRRGVLGGIGAALLGTKPATANMASTPSVEIPDQSTKSPAWVKDFISTYVPLINQANKELENDRERLLTILHKKSITGVEERWIDSKMTQYNCASPQELLSHIDVVPVSLVLTQSAIESNWGRSKIAKHNALFGQKTWDKKDNIHGYKKFKSPLASIKAYMQNINSNKAYANVRRLREQLRKNRKPITGLELAAGLTHYSTAGSEYIDQIKTTILSQGFNSFDTK